MKQKLFPTMRHSGLIALLAFVLMAFGLQSCKTVALPSDTSSTINKLGTDLPRLMGQASNSYTGVFGDQAQMLINDINRAANAANASGSKRHKKVGDMLVDLSVNKLIPFLDRWKVQGKLQPNEITAGIKDVNDALAAIRKQAKMN